MPEVADRPGKHPIIVCLNDYRAPITVTAEFFDVDPKRLRGWMLRETVHAPLGNVREGWVYPFTVQRFLARQLRAGKEGKP